MFENGSTLFVVQTNHVPGGESEYHDWYNSVHIPDILSVPGFVAAQRFELGPVQRRPELDHPYRYLALYEIAGDPRAAFGALDEAKPRMASSPMLADQRVSVVYEPITPRIEAKRPWTNS